MSGPGTTHAVAALPTGAVGRRAARRPGPKVGTAVHAAEAFGDAEAVDARAPRRDRKEVAGVDLERSRRRRAQPAGAAPLAVPTGPTGGRDGQQPAWRGPWYT